MGFFAAGFLAAFLAFLAAGFFAFFTFFAAGFLAFLAFFAAGFLAFLAFLGLGSSLASLKDPLTGTSFLAANIFLMASLARTLALSASAILLLARMYLRIAGREEPPRSFRALMAAAIMTA